MRPRDEIEPFDDEAERPSRSAFKREAQALQDLGTAIVDLTDGELATLPLDGDLAEAIAQARRLKGNSKTREGLRRQLQFIGKLMRKRDTEALQAAYDELQQGRQQRNQQFHRLEQLRDTLVAEGVAAMDQVLERYPEADRRQLRQLIVAAVKERDANQPPAAARKLFRYLRELAAL
jgi:ribosome-associated protein